MNDSNIWFPTHDDDPAEFTFAGSLIYRMLHALRSRYSYPRFKWLEDLLLGMLSAEQRHAVGWHLVDNFSSQYMIEGTACS